MARAAARVLDASVVLIDRSGAVLAVAGASPDQEKKLLEGGEAISVVELRVAEAPVGELRYRTKTPPDPAIARMVTTLLALELERARSPEWESEEVAGAFVAAVLAREVTDRGDIVARAAEVGSDLEKGAGVVIVRAAPRAAQTGKWRERVLTLSMRALRSLAPGALASSDDGEAAAEIAVIVPAEDDERLSRAAAGLARELDQGLPGFHLTIGCSRRAADPVDLYRAGNEARLAVNVGEAEERPLLAFEDTGAYRLLLPAMSEDPGELQRFYAETVEPLVGLRRAVRDRAGRHRRGLPRQRRQRRGDRQTALHPPPHDPLPARAGQGALRPRRLGDRRAREARPRAEGDARARHRLAARAGARAGRRRRQGATRRRRSRAPQSGGRIRTSASRTKTWRAADYTTPDQAPDLSAHPGAGRRGLIASGVAHRVAQWRWVERRWTRRFARGSRAAGRR